MENRKYCSEIAKVKRIILVRIWSRIFVWGSLVSPIISPQRRAAFLIETFKEILEQNLLQNCQKTLAEDVSNLSHKVNTLLKYKTSLSKWKVEKVKWSTFGNTEFIFLSADTQKPHEDDKSKALDKEFASEWRRAARELLAVAQESEQQI